MLESCLHSPVMLSEVLFFFELSNKMEPDTLTFKEKSSNVFIDGTFGGGGYSKGILESSLGKVIAIDRDPSVYEIAKNFKENYKERFFFENVNFSEIDSVINKHSKHQKISGIVFDFGVSSMQIDNGARGFSFMNVGPLDMRMDRRSKLTAEEVLNDFSENDLTKIIMSYGDEPFAPKISNAVILFRKKKDLKIRMN